MSDLYGAYLGACQSAGVLGGEMKSSILGQWVPENKPDCPSHLEILKPQSKGRKAIKSFQCKN